MAETSNTKRRYLARLDEIITQAENLPSDSKQRVKSVDIDGRRSYSTDHFLKYPEFVEWRTSAASILHAVVPESSIHRYAVDQFPQLPNKLHVRDYGISFLKSIRDDFELGFFEELVSEVDAEISAEYLGQAEQLLSYSRPSDQGEVAAAVIAGAVLEHNLRLYCARLEPSEPLERNGKLSSLGSLIDALKKRRVFNELTAKQLRAWADIRNAAAHGNFNEFSRQQVESMVSGTVAFLARHGSADF